MMKEALFWEKTMDDFVNCQLCMRKCLITEGKLGWCQTRINKNGTLYTLTYGNVSSMSIAPIEKKPMYHFFPGTSWLSLGGLGCNFGCRGCQSWRFSHCNVQEKLLSTTYLSPEMVIKKAKKNNCQGIAFTYNEPTMWFEYVLDVFKLAKKEGLSTCCVSNGFMNPKALEMINTYLDGFCIDIKGAFMESYTRICDISDINTIFNNATDAKRKFAVHVEVVTNVISGYNSNEKELKEIGAWIFAELGKDTPWHLTRFFPAGELKDVAPTSIGLLENFQRMGLKEGIYYVYIGNVPGHECGNTFCQNCKKILIRRKEYDVVENYLVEGHCPYCRASIFGRFSRASK